MRLLTRIGLALLFVAQLSSIGLAQSGIITTYVSPGLPVNNALAASQAIDSPTSVAPDGAGGFYVVSTSQNRVYRVTADGRIHLAAGNGTLGFSGDGGPATSAQLSTPTGIAVDTAGNLFIADIANDVVRKVTPGGVISTVAGNGDFGFSGDGGTATSAQLQLPYGVAVDTAGNLFISDWFNQCVRKVTPGGVISTVAGNGTQGFSGDGGPATSAQLNGPHGIAVDTAGNLFIADWGNGRIRKVTPNGVIGTVAGNGNPFLSGDGGLATSATLYLPTGVAVDKAGNLLIADTGNHCLRKVTPGGIISTVAGDGIQGFSGDGGRATSARLDNPAGVAADPAGNLLIADTNNNRVRRVTLGGVISTAAGNGSWGYSGDGGPATSAQLSFPSGVAMDTAGNLFIIDGGISGRIRKVAPGGVISTVAGGGTNGLGDGGPATAVHLCYPSGVAVDHAGNLFIADQCNNNVRKVTPGGVISTVAGNGTVGFSGDTGPATSAQLHGPTGVAVDAAGNLFIADTLNNRIRKVAPGGVISTVAGNGTVGFGGDRGPATSAQLNGPTGVAVDTAGNLFIADTNNNLVRKVSWDGFTNVNAYIITVAGNAVGRTLIGDGPAIEAQLIGPAGVAVDAAGNLFIAEAGIHWVRMVTPGGMISMMAGIGIGGFSGDGGPATSAQLNGPQGLAVDTAGNLFIADTLNNRVRKVADIAPASTFFPQIAVGSGWDTLFTVTNTGSTAASANLFLTDPEGNPIGVSGVLTDSLGTIQPTFPGYSFAFTVPAGGTVFLAANALNPNDPIKIGSAQLESRGGSLTGVATYEYVVGGNVQNGVGVLQAQLLRIATIPVDNDTTQGQQVAYAIANPSSQTVSIGLVLVGQDGTVVDYAPTVTLGPGQQIARYLYQDLPARANFKGSLVLRGLAGPSFIAVALLQKQGLYTVIPLNPGSVAPLSPAGLAESGKIKAYAGPGYPVNGSLATSQYIDHPSSVAWAGAGGFYVASTLQSRVYRVAADGRINLVAGNGTQGFSGDGGPAISAELFSPNGVAVDAAGNLYIADTGNCRVRKVTPGGVISTVAGVGTYGSSGDGGPAASAYFRTVVGVAVDTAGNLFISDTASHSVRKVTPGGVISTVWVDDLFLGPGIPTAIAVDAAGNLFISDTANHSVFKVTPGGVKSTVAGSGTWRGAYGSSGDGGPATAALLNTPSGLAVDRYGALYIADTGNNRIRMVTTDGLIRTVAGNGTQGFSGDGGLPTSAQLNQPSGVAMDGVGNLLIVDTTNQRVREVPWADGLIHSPTISTVAGNGIVRFSGDGGPATSALLDTPLGVAVDGEGSLFIADANNNRVRKVTSSGVISTVAGNGTGGFSEFGISATNAKLNYPNGVAVDAAGNLFIADSKNNRIRKVTPGGMMSTVAGNGTAGYGGDGGPATSAQLNYPSDVAVDTSGNLFIADRNNQRVRKVTPGGMMSTVAGNGTASYGGDGGPATSARLYNPSGVAVDKAGNLFIADQDNHRVREVTPGGVISTAAGNGTQGYSGDGGPATSAQLNSPSGVAVDMVGNNLLIADTRNYCVRVVTPGGLISTVAGIGTYGYSGDGGPATSARLNQPTGVAMDMAGNLFIADTGNSCIREVTLIDSAATYFPQVVVGGGWDTRFTVTNTGSTQITANLILTDQQGNPITVSGVLTDSFGTTQPAYFGSSFVFTVPAGGTVFLSVHALSFSDPTKVGWAQLESTGGPLTGVATYEDVVGGTVQNTVGVLQSQPLQFATIPVNNDNTQGQQLAYAIANPSSQTVSVKLALVGQDGTVVDDTITVTLGPGKQLARYLWQDLPARANFRGSLVLRGQAGAGFVVVGLLQKQGLYTVIPLIPGKAPGIPN